MNTASVVSTDRSFHATLLDVSVGHDDYLNQLTSRIPFKPSRCLLPMTY